MPADELRRSLRRAGGTGSSTAEVLPAPGGRARTPPPPGPTRRARAPAPVRACPVIAPRSTEAPSPGRVGSDPGPRLGRRLPLRPPAAAAATSMPASSSNDRVGMEIATARRHRLVALRCPSDGPRSGRRTVDDLEQPVGDQLVEVECGELAGDVHRPRRLLSRQRSPRGPHGVVQPSTLRVLERSDRPDRRRRTRTVHDLTVSLVRFIESHHHGRPDALLDRSTILRLTFIS